MNEFRKAGEVQQKAPLPKDAGALSALRTELAARAARIASEFTTMSRTDPRRPALVAEKASVDGELRRVNASLATANRAQNNTEPVGVPMDVASGLLTPRQQAAISVACAILSGPGATKFFTQATLDVNDLVETAWDVVHSATEGVPDGDVDDVVEGPADDDI